MGWFRRNLRWGTRLALLALTVQLALTFSHVHLDGVRQLHEYAKSVAAADNDGAPPTSPAPKHDPICAVCTLLQLAGSALSPDAPPLALPQQFALVPPPAQAAPAMAAPSHLSFNARAPPSA
jgi:hypothetical protein